MLIGRGGQCDGRAVGQGIGEVAADPRVSREKHDRQDNQREDPFPFHRAGRCEIPSALVSEETSRKIDNATPWGVKDMNSKLQGMLSHAESKASSGQGFAAPSACPERARPR